MNLDKKIKEILEEVWNDNMSPESEGDRETVIKAHKDLKQLFLQELKACLPEKKETNAPASHYGYYNQALDEVEQNINKLSEEVREK